MEPSTIQPPPIQRQPPVHYAGFWKRFLAWVIDEIIIGIGMLIIAIPFLVILGISIFSMGQYEGEDSPLEFIFAFIGLYMVLICILMLAKWLYFALMESKKGAMFGKMALGIRVTDMGGNRVSFGRATGRYFAKMLSGLIYLVGYMMAGWTQQKQVLHDILASCLVVDDR